MKCWGYNDFYNLGTGDNYNYGYYPYSMGVYLPHAKFGTNVKAADLCVADRFTCIATPQGKVKCLGLNLGGGLGHENDQSTRERIGDLLAYTNLGSNFKAKSLTCGLLWR